MTKVEMIRVLKSMQTQAIIQREALSSAMLSNDWMGFEEGFEEPAELRAEADLLSLVQGARASSANHIAALEHIITRLGRGQRVV